MEEAYFQPKLKRKDLDEVNDDFCDFSLSSPARKIRRLDAELPPIIEEEETVNPVVFGQPPAPSQDNFVEQVVSGIHELNGSLPENEERAIVLFDPMNNMPPLQPRSPFSFSVNSDFLSGYKNPAFWSNRSDLLKSLNGKKEKHDDNSELKNRSLAVVPWVPKREMAEVEAPRVEMMDSDDMEATTMDIEDQPVFGSVAELKQHCMIQQPPHNLSTPIAWSAGTGA